MNANGINDHLSQILFAALTGIDRAGAQGASAAPLISPFGPVDPRFFAGRSGPEAFDALDPFAKQTILSTVSSFASSGSNAMYDPNLTLADKLLLLMAFITEEREKEIGDKIAQIEKTGDGKGEGSLTTETTKLNRMMQVLNQFKTLIMRAINDLSQTERRAAEGR